MDIFDARPPGRIGADLDSEKAGNRRCRIHLERLRIGLDRIGYISITRQVDADPWGWCGFCRGTCVYGQKCNREAAKIGFHEVRLFVEQLEKIIRV